MTSSRAARRTTTDGRCNAQPNGIIRPGRNAWQAGRADKAAFLIDGAAYFTALDQALRKAKAHDLDRRLGFQSGYKAAAASKL
jgi:hypothetical protein